MPTDNRIPGVSLRADEQVVAIMKPHWVVFIRFVNIFILPIIPQFLKWKNEAYVLTTQRVIEQYGVISTTQKNIELDKIQDVSSGVRGILARLMGVGWVLVQTGGKDSNVEMVAISKPREVCDQIQNEMSAAKKRSLVQMAQAMKA